MERVPDTGLRAGEVARRPKNPGDTRRSPGEAPEAHNRDIDTLELL